MRIGNQKKPGIAESGVYNPDRDGVTGIARIAFRLGPGESIDEVKRKVCPSKRDPRFASMIILDTQPCDRPNSWALLVVAQARVEIGGATILGWFRIACSSLGYQCGNPRYYAFHGLTSQNLVYSGHSPGVPAGPSRKGSWSDPIFKEAVQ